MIRRITFTYVQAADHSSSHWVSVKFPDPAQVSYRMRTLLASWFLELGSDTLLLSFILPSIWRFLANDCRSLPQATVPAVIDSASAPRSSFTSPSLYTALSMASLQQGIGNLCYHIHLLCNSVFTAHDCFLAVDLRPLSRGMAVFFSIVQSG